MRSGADLVGDGALVDAVRAGDFEAFNVLYARHVRSVRLAIRDNVHEPEAVADAVQDTFARALERLPSLREPERFGPWLRSIARHVAIDQRRARLRAAARDAGDTDDIEDGGASPGEQAELAELAELVNGCVGGLSSRDATLITMVGRLGLSPTEVAAAIGTTPGAAKVAAHRARRRLRDALTLELMVRAQGTPCDEFEDIRVNLGITAAATHVRQCDRCVRAAQDELQLYHLDVDPVPGEVVHSPSMRT